MTVRLTHAHSHTRERNQQKSVYNVNPKLYTIHRAANGSATHEILLIVHMCVAEDQHHLLNVWNSYGSEFKYERQFPRKPK